MLTKGHSYQTRKPKTEKGDKMNKIGFVYIMTNKNRTTLYIGVTNDLCRRIYEHKNHLIKNSFTDKYNLEYCIYFEEFHYFDLAIKREKELKKWSRIKKEDLINKKNPEWKVVATENGFVRKNKPFSQQVNDLINELQQNGEIPDFPKTDSHSEQNTADCGNS
jgi:putative endonuclease